MRHALSLKPTNANPSAAVTQSLKNGAAAPLGKLTRQTGTSNLRQNVIVKIETTSEVKENFEVFEDPVDETSTNNVIHDLERKMEQKSREEEQKQKELEERNRFLLTRNNDEIMSVYSEPPSEVTSVCATYDDDDCDKLSVASSTFTTVRASFSQFHVYGKHKEEEEAKQAISRRKKAEREERDEAMFTSEEYFSDIFRYMSHRQMTLRPPANYISRQAEVNAEMRTILIDWFNDVVKEYRMQKETLHLAVSIVDRVMSFLRVEKVQFQLVGTTALMIAAKYEEIFPPETGDFAVITDNTYRVSDILKMERYLLAQLKFVVSTPTAAWFGSSFARRMRYTKKMNKTLDYLLDLSLTDIDFLRYRPSDIAAAACFFANLQHDSEGWPQKMEDDTGLKTDNFVECLKELHRLYLCASTADNKSIFNKYCEHEEHEVALMPAPSNQLFEQFPAVFGVKKTGHE